jgi:hypothetical protein
MKPHREEGWYTDPYGVHEARWFSDGRPTKLARDGSNESNHEPPDEPYSKDPISIEAEAAIRHGADLRRADEAEAGNCDSEKASLAALDIMIQSPGNF